jgi:transcriptional regulator with XRE-family HTH domain
MEIHKRKAMYHASLNKAWADMALIKKLRAENRSLSQIARQYDVSKGTISAILKADQLTRAEKIEHYQKLHSLWRDAATIRKQSHEGGFSLRELAYIHGVTHTTISEILSAT